LEIKKGEIDMELILQIALVAVVSYSFVRSIESEINEEEND
jgi:hypothetical protein